MIFGGRRQHICSSVLDDILVHSGESLAESLFLTHLAKMTNDSVGENLWQLSTPNIINIGTHSLHLHLNCLLLDE